jgi:cobalt-zinc-cadmium efflux system membrane fusion protein
VFGAFVMALLMMLTMACQKDKTSSSVQKTTAKDWCVEHRIPESKCTKCNPKLIPKYKKSGDWCKGHGFPESVCPSCNPAPLPPGIKKRSPKRAGTLIRFRSQGIERAAGIRVVPATRIKLAKSITCIARIDFDRNRFAEIRSPIPALLHRLLINTGQRVKRGRSLFVLSSARISALKAQMRASKEALAIAKVALARLLRLRRSRISTVPNVEQARLRVAQARSKLTSIQQSLRIGGIRILGSAGYFRLLSPLSGMVVTRPAVIGSQAGPGVLLATIADTRKMWAILNLNEWEAPLIRVGQKVRVRVNGIASRLFEGKVIWLASHVNPRTRIVQARVELKSHGLLRANQFGRATIRVSRQVGGVTVPLQAVQKTDDGSVIFVRLKAGLYETRQVSLGRSDGHRVQLKGRLKPGEQVVTTGAFLLRTELSKSSIGAGCCDVKKPGEK